MLFKLVMLLVIALPFFYFTASDEPFPFFPCLVWLYLPTCLGINCHDIKYVICRCFVVFLCAVIMCEFSTLLQLVGNVDKVQQAISLAKRPHIVVSLAYKLIWFFALFFCCAVEFIIQLYGLMFLTLFWTWGQILIHCLVYKSILLLIRLKCLNWKHLAD